MTKGRQGGHCEMAVEGQKRAEGSKSEQKRWDGQPTGAVEEEPSEAEQNSGTERGIF